MVSKFSTILKKRESGITLIEIIVVIFITMMFSLILISDFPKIQKQYALSSATYKLSQDFRKTEDLGLSGIKLNDVNGKQIFVKGYGIYISSNSKQYKIYADIATLDNPKGNQKFDDTNVACDKYDINNDQGDCIMETIDLAGRNPSLKIMSIDTIENNNSHTNFNYISINFMPPNPIINIDDETSNVYSGIKIILGLVDNTSTRTVLVNTAGLINVQ